MSKEEALEKKAAMMKHKELWEASGLSQSAYCKKEGLPYKRFNYEISKLNARRPKGGFQFIEARPKTTVDTRVTEGDASVRIELVNGIVVALELSALWTLSRVLEVAGGL